MGIVVIDRRQAPNSRMAGNRQRAINRAREAVKEAAAIAASKRSIQSTDSQPVTVAATTLDEPHFSRVFSGGKRNIVLCGNETYIVGDKISKSDQSTGRGSGKGSGNGGDGEGEGVDFVLTMDEYLDLVFDGLELPNLTKESISQTEVMTIEPDGIAASGSPSNLALLRSMRNAKGRRIGLRRPSLEEIEQVQARIDDAEGEAEKEALSSQLRSLQQKRKNVPFLDKIDLRFHKYDLKPRPVTKAVFLMLMDVSGSMSSERRSLAKRMFLLIYTFLKKTYKNLDVVFVRHTTEAQETDEDTFFYGDMSGGTIVSSGLAEAYRILSDRYSPDEYNIYVAQASDGDNYESDNALSHKILTEMILPIVQFMLYLEIMPWNGRSDIWAMYNEIADGSAGKMMAKEIADEATIYPIFREIFQKRSLEKKKNDS